MSKSRNQPNHRDLYLLVIGMAVGLLLSEWSLGRISIDIYEQLFIGGQEARLNKEVEKAALKNKLEEKEVDLRQRKERIEDLKTDTAMDDFIAQANAERIEVAEMFRNKIDHYRLEQDKQASEHAARYQRLLTGLIMVIVVMMILETLLEPEADGFAGILQGRLGTVRYAVMAGWLAL